MIPVDCDTCKHKGACKLESAQHQATVMAWAHRVPAPDCLEYQERTWRGIEGVLDLRGRQLRSGRNTPRPSAPHRLGSSINVIEARKEWEE